MDPNQPEITVYPQPKEELPPPVSITPTLPTLPDAVAQQRAYKASQGLGFIGKTYDSVLQDIVNGQEEHARASAAADLDFRKSQVAHDLITHMVNEKQGPLTNEDIASVIENAKPGTTNPETVFEAYYGKKYMNELKNTAKRTEGNLLDKAAADMPVQTQALTALADESATKREYLTTKLQNLAAQYKDQNILGKKGFDFLKNFLPGYEQFNVRSGGVDDVGFFQGGAQGENYDEQRMKLYSLPMDQFKAQIDRVIGSLNDGVAGGNTQTAMKFLGEMLGRSLTDKYLDNIMSVVDVASIPGITAGVKGISRIARGAQLAEVKGAIKDTLKAAAADPTDTAAVVEATGDIRTAAVEKSAQNIAAKLERPDVVDQQVVDGMMTGWKTAAVEMEPKGNTNLSNELARRIQDRFTRLGDKVVDAIKNMIRVERVPVIRVTKDMSTLIKAGIEKNFSTDVTNNIIDMDMIYREPFSNTWHVEIKFGDSTLGQWTSQHAAESWAEHQGFMDYEAVRKGLGYHIVWRKPLNETDDLFRDILLKTSSVNAVDGGLFKSLSKFARGSEDTLSIAERANRKAVAYGRSYILKQNQEDAKLVEDLVNGKVTHDPYTGEKYSRPVYLTVYKNKRYLDWQRIVEQTAHIEDEATGIPGRFYKDLGELEYAYRRTLGRSPDAVEAQAYFAYRNMMEMDRVLRTVASARNKYRTGTMQYKIPTIKDAEGNVIDTPFFEAIQLKAVPTGHGAILSIKGDIKTSRFDRIDGYGQKTMEAMQKAVAEGRAQILQIYDASLKPLRGLFPSVGDRKVSYVYMEGAFQNKNISWADQVTSRGGYHMDPDYQHFVKQAIVNPDMFGTGKNRVFNHWYEGDRTLLGVKLPAMGQGFADRMNKIRELIKAGDIDGAKALHGDGKNGVPWTWDEFGTRFFGKRVDGIMRHPELNLDEPFEVVHRDSKIMDKDTALQERYRYFDDKGIEHTTLIDGTRSGPAKQYEVPYTQERDNVDFREVLNNGTHTAPDYQLGAGKFIDPVPALNAALNKVANSILADDYKIFSMEHWLQRAKQWMNIEPNDLRGAPFYYFTNAFEHMKKEMPEDMWLSLKSDWRKINQFIGARSEVDSFLEASAQKLSDSLYEHGRDQLALIPNHLLPYAKDANAWMRSMAFHLYMGLGSVAQLPIQMSTYVQIFGLAGAKYASSGTNAALFTMWSRVNKNPEILSALDARIVKVSNMVPGMAKWKPGDLTESLKLLDHTGFGNVGSEYAMLDYLNTPTIATSTTQRYLDAGKWFFTQGERMTRWGAWHTAYREFRDVNPLKSIGNVELQSILERADMLNINMSRASSSEMQHGVFALPMQFFTYVQHLGETFWSKRLGDTLGERNLVRARMLGYNAALFGVPGMVGTMGLPLGDNIKKYAMEHGYVVGDKWLTPLIEGGLATAIAAISGGGDIHKGTMYNIADRYGQQGVTSVKQMLFGDKGFWGLLGAAPNALINTITSFSGFARWGVSLMKGELDESMMPTDKALTDVLNNAAAFNHTRQYLIALKSGEIISKNEGLIETGVSAKDATMRYLFGLTSAGAQNLRDKEEIITARKDNAAYGEKKFVEYMHSYMRNKKDQNDGQAEEDRKMAYLYLKLYVPQELFAQALSRVADKDNIIDSVDWSFGFKDVMPDQANTMIESARRTQQYKNIRQGN